MNLFSDEYYQELQSLYPVKIFDFLKFHGPQLQYIGVDLKDIQTIQKIYCKLSEEIFDAGIYFQIYDNEDLEEFQLKSIKQVEKGSVFLIDHAFTFRYRDLRDNLLKNPQIIPRLQEMMKYAPIKRQQDTNNNSLFYQEYDSQEITNPLQYQIFNDTISVSFYENNISDLNLIDQFLQKNKQLKVIWFNENPLDQIYLKNIIQEKYKNIEILNSEFTENATLFAVKFVSLDQDFFKFQNTQNHQIKKINLSRRQIFQLIENFIESICQNFFNCMILDISENLIDGEAEKKIDILIKNFKNLKEIIVDKQYEKELFQKYKLKINGFYSEPEQIDYEIREIYDKIWAFTGNYRLQDLNKLDESCIWYIMDEVGLAIQHSEQPNSHCVPFLFSPNNQIDQNLIAYTLLFIDQDLLEQVIIKRDFLQNVTNQKEDRLLKFQNSHYIEKFQLFQNQINKKNLFQNEQNKQNKIKFEKYPVKFYTDSKLIEKAISSKEFEICDDINECQIIWINDQIQDDFDFKNKLVNQFPFEYNLTMKDKLASIVQNQLGRVDWMQTTYNLQNQYQEFLGDFFLRKQNYQDNLWIIKHPNLARSIDMTVTDNLDLIQKLSESTPRIAQKYIESPFLLNNKKVDFRFIIAVKSFDPLEIYLYEKFWIRSANKDFNLDERNIFDYTTHFTVMNYGPNVLQKILCDDFIKQFNLQNDWSQVYKQIQLSLKALFTAAIQEYPNIQNENSRAIYGIDLMLDSKFQPKILEITYAPDCIRAVDYYPEFFNDIFKCLFLDQNISTLIRI